MPAVLLAPEAPPLVLEPSDEAPAKARRYLTDRFREFGHADDFVGRLVVTELVTNSCKHVGIGHIVVRIVPDVREPLTVIEVWDQGTALPVVRDEDLGAMNGRGLLLMSELVHDWGVRPINEEGKIVWARCAR
ncbi:ATP-binding protein [Actinomadura latina]|uniref:ATP-binding protein n=1 Tax=Actinomadura latina TaxID=163603 RepID=A0A846YVG9_9ACTN|nr:ATP-binding protein [Actinomadura latina]NKZ02498.1 ATP-binding protein [Actinomadura latina]